MKFLINALSGNGDALMFSPALYALKKKIPDAEIDMLVMFKSVSEMFNNDPSINQIHYIDFLKQPKLKSIRQVLGLRKKKYDVSINIYPSNRFEYNAVNYLLGAKHRVAFDYIYSGFFSLQFLNSNLIKEEKDRHNVLQNMEVVKLFSDVKDDDIGNMHIYLSEDDKKRAEEWIGEINGKSRTIIGFHPGSALLKNHINKRWDKNKFSELGKLLMEKYNALILLFGNEFELNYEINSLLNGKCIIASTDNYMDSLSRMEHCNLFVSNDTAFLHSSAALGIPSVAIFAYTNYKELYPWKSKHIIVRKELECSPCFYNSPKPASCKWNGDEKFKCMKLITVEDVFSACQILL